MLFRLPVICCSGRKREGRRSRENDEMFVYRLSFALKKLLESSVRVTANPVGRR